MNEKIDPELFSHLVDLAALQLNEEEAEYLRGELNSQLQAIDELAAIQLDASTPAASHGVPYSADIRPDIRADKSQMAPEVDAILGQAPEIEDRYIVVPDIPHEDLD